MKNISFRNDVLPLKNILYRLALRITLNREEAEDIVQDTLIKVWNKREDWDSISSIEAFSLTICRNLSLDRLKHLGSSSFLPIEENLAVADVVADPYDAMHSKDRMEIVKRIVDRLPEKQKSCMHLRDFEGKSYREIAKILGISQEQVKVNIFRARQTVKQKYQQYDKDGL